MNLKQAQEIAHNVCVRLQPFSVRLNIAGSVRRQKPDVKDIEVVCLPRYVTAAQESLFDEVVASTIISSNYVEAVKSLGRIVKGKPDGKYMQIHLPQRINLDLFMPDDFDYFRQYAIRTGSAEFAAKQIAAGWRRKGWCGSDKGLRLISDCMETKQPDGKSKWTCINGKAERPPVWQSEQEFFEWLGITWVHPKYRF